jgi:hypothetical protein
MNQQTNERRVFHVFSPSLGILYRFQEGTGVRLQQVPPKPPRDLNVFEAKAGTRYQFGESSLTFTKGQTVPPKPRDLRVFKVKSGTCYQFGEGRLTFTKKRAWWDDESSDLEDREPTTEAIEKYLS